MTINEFILAVATFTHLDLVKAHRQTGDTAFALELWADMERRDRSQVVQVQLTDEQDLVFVYSIVGEFPDDAETLKLILQRTAHTFYARVSLDQGNLVLVFVHQLERMDQARLAEAIYEVSRNADALEEEFFGEDRH